VVLFLFRTSDIGKNQDLTGAGQLVAADSRNPTKGGSRRDHALRFVIAGRSRAIYARLLEGQPDRGLSED